MLASVSLVLITLTVILLNHWKTIRKHQWLLQFQGPSPTLPIIGNGLEFVGHPSGMAETFHRNFQRFGTVWRLWLMDKPSLVTSDPELLKTLLGSQEHIEKHFIYDLGATIAFGEYGLVTSKPKQWKGDRKLLNTLFNLEFFGKSFKQCVNDWSKLEKHLQTNLGKPIQCEAVMRKFFLYIIWTSFDVDESFCTDEMLSEYSELMDRGLELIKIRFLKPWSRNSLYWKVFGYEREYKYIMGRVESIGDELIKLCEDKMQKIESGESETIDQKSSRTTLELLGNKMVPRQWKLDQSLTFVLAGTDTSTIASTMTLFFLALNPECQKKAHDEIDLLFEERSHGELQFTDMSKLKYLRMCIKEAMRLHSPVSLIGRNTTEEIRMRDGRKIPSGTSVLIVIPEVHMDPDNFPDPLTFDPERLSESNLSSIKPYTYMPFSNGPRNCIGQKYSESILVSVLAYVLRNYSVRTHQKASDVKSLYEMAGTPYPKVELGFDPRI